MNEGELGRVIEWLKEIDLGADEKEQIKEEAGPRTPPRRQYERLLYEEVSPTDTTFSGASIFDKSYRQHEELDRPRQCRDDISEATSVDEDDEKPTRQTVFDARSGTLFDDGPDSTVDEIYAEVQPRSVFEPNTIRLTTIISCLQCTLASLPCSRTSPSCTRCIRNNFSSFCLLQRRLFDDEIADTPPELCLTPVLLKLATEDEGSWKKKMEAKHELMRVWKEKRNKENWVLPSVESKRGGWRKYGRFDTMRIGVGVGEGSGRLRCEEVVVDADIIRA